MKEKLREKLKKRQLNSRAILRLAESREFGRAYDDCTEKQREELKKLLDDPDTNITWVREWLADVTRCPLAALSYRKLRDLARSNNVYNYSRLDKDELIKELEKADARLLAKRPKSD
jgi:hypothetical protein